jgi:CemA family
MFFRKPQLWLKNNGFLRKEKSQCIRFLCICNAFENGKTNPNGWADEHDTTKKRKTQPNFTPSEKPSLQKGYYANAQNFKETRGADSLSNGPTQPISQQRNYDNAGNQASFLGGQGPLQKKSFWSSLNSIPGFGGFNRSGQNTGSRGQSSNSRQAQNQVPTSKTMRDALNAKGFNTEFKNNAFNKKLSKPFITYEEIGFFPRSFSRVFDRFFKQIFSDVENLVIQEYRFYRYLFLTTIQTIFILLFVPLVVNFIAKTYLIRPITEYFWNTKQTEIFLNSYEQKRAFLELQDFEEKLYFESLLISNSSIKQKNYLGSGINNIGSVGRAQATLIEQNLCKKENDITSYCITDQVVQSKPNPSLVTTSLVDFKESNNNFIRDQGSGGTVNNSPKIFNLPWFLSTMVEENQKTGQATTISTNFSGSESPRMSNWTAEGLFSQTDNKNVKSSQQLQTTNPIGAAKGMSGYRQPQLEASPVAEGSNFDFLEKQRTNPESLFIALADSLQEKTLELAIRYNNHSIESITNFFADFLSLITLFYLLVSLEIQINITKSFLLEVFFGLDDSKKSLLILIITDLLVGYHSSNLWELFFQFIFNHYGIPESQTGIFLLVATLPVLLDVLFKYLIFRHLNRSSPATVATYHAIIE